MHNQDWSVLAHLLAIVHYGIPLIVGLWKWFNHCFNRHD